MSTTGTPVEGPVSVGTTAATTTTTTTTVAPVDGVPLSSSRVVPSGRSRHGLKGESGTHGGYVPSAAAMKHDRVGAHANPHRPALKTKLKTVVTFMQVGPRVLWVRVSPYVRWAVCDIGCMVLQVCG